MLLYQYTVLNVVSPKRSSYIVLNRGWGVCCVACWIQCGIDRLAFQMFCVDMGGRSSIIPRLPGQYYNVLLLSCNLFSLSFLFYRQFACIVLWCCGVVPVRAVNLYFLVTVVAVFCSIHSCYQYCIADATRTASISLSFVIISVNNKILLLSLWVGFCHKFILSPNWECFSYNYNFWLTHMIFNIIMS
jgi:hypothetical protein